MNTKKILILACCVILGAFALGATNTVRVCVEAKAENGSLAGVLVTREVLSLSENSQSADGICRVYAAVTETVLTDEETGESYTERNYVFDRIRGWSILMPMAENAEGPFRDTWCDPAFTECAFSLNGRDDGEDIRAEAKLCVLPDGGQDSAYFFNPVYQLSGGELYAVPGEFISFGDMTAGASFGMTLRDEEKHTEDGKETSFTSEFSISIQLMNAPETIFVAQFDGNDALLAKTGYTPGTLPESLKPVPEAEYLIVETVSHGPERLVNRKIIQKEDEWFTAFCPVDGVCFPQSCGIEWE